MRELISTNFGAHAEATDTLTFATSKTFGKTHSCTILVSKA